MERGLMRNAVLVNNDGTKTEIQVPNHPPHDWRVPVPTIHRSPRAFLNANSEMPNYTVRRYIRITDFRDTAVIYEETA